MKMLVLTGMLAAGTLLAMGCKTVDNAVDCHKICDRYKTCFDRGYNTGACEDRCRDEADTEGYATKADACDDCIGDKSCASATFMCAKECGGIVP